MKQVWRYGLLSCLLTFLCVPGVTLGAVNDNFADAIQLVGAQGQITGDNSDATSEPEEYNVPKTVWYKYQASVSGILKLRVQSNVVYPSYSNPSLQIFKGTSIIDLEVINPIIVVDDTDGYFFPATAGQEYYIRIYDYSSGGPFTLTWQLPVAVHDVSGTFTLPDNAPTTDADRYITANIRYNWNSLVNNFMGGSAYGVVLPANSRSGSFNFKVADSLGQFGLFIDSYDYYSSSVLQRVWQYSYYNSSGSVWYGSGMELLSSNQDNAVTIPLLESTKISGSIRTPNNQIFDQDYSLEVAGIMNVPGSTSEQWFQDNYTYTLADGSSAVDYSVTVPKIATGALLYYRFNYGTQPPAGIYNEGYYADSGFVTKKENATLINVTQDNPNFDIPLIQGKTISGTMRLQGTDTLAQETSLNVAAYDAVTHQYITSNYDNTNQGAAALPFSITLPPDAAPFTLDYNLWPVPDGYSWFGYFKKNQTTVALTSCEAEQTTMNINDNLSDLDLTLIKGPVISGSISLPGGLLASASIPVDIGKLTPDVNGQYSSANFQLLTRVTIPAGQNAASYSFSSGDGCATGGGQFILGYRHANADYVRYGYYGTPTKGNPSNATPLTSNQTLQNVNMQLMAGSTISGTISLPNGITTPAEGLNVTLGTLIEPNSLYHTTVTIPSGEQSINYSVRMASDTENVALGYWLSDSAPVAAKGFYRAAAADYVTGRLDQADKFMPGSNITGKNFVLAEGNAVSGAINTPGGLDHSVPIVVSLAAEPTTPESIYWHTAVVIPGQNTSTAYSHRVILDSPATMKFENPTVTTWTPQGYYYSNAVSVPRVDQATVLQAHQEHQDINLFVHNQVPGDTNFDGQVNLVDIILNLQIMAGSSSSAGQYTPRADVNGDGRLGLPETLYILKQLSH